MSDPVVFVSGLNATASLFADQISAMSVERTVVLANHRRHATLPELGSALVDELPARFVLAGLSMGGYVAFELLRRVPERISALVLMDTSARPDTDEQKETRERRIRLVEGGRFADVVSAQLPALIHPSRQGDGELVAAIRAMAEETGPEAYVRQQLAILSRPDSRPDLPRISCPTLVVVGDQDAITPREVAEEMSGAIPGARIAVMPVCGHLSAMERPTAVTHAMAGFLTEAGV